MATEDGHYVTQVLEVHYEGAGKGNYIAHSSGMFFDQYGLVYIALSNYG